MMISILASRAVIAWIPVEPIEIATVNGCTLHIDEDGSLAFSGTDDVLYRLDDELAALVQDDETPAAYAAVEGWVALESGDLGVIAALIELARDELRPETPVEGFAAPDLC